MVIKQRLAAGLVLGSLGVVFGDIGTSPLYAFEAIFSPIGRHLLPHATNILGVTSLIIWSITLTVTVKFIGFIMRADNEGEGGILALLALIKRTAYNSRHQTVLIMLGIIGAALFYGDAAITPAISVLSAIEGLKLVSPSIAQLVIPITVVILIGLFVVQKYGTSIIGAYFSPVMTLWFATIAAGGLSQIWHEPQILAALSPLMALSFIVRYPLVTFIALGAIILVMTGAEALYADMGHFGRPAIARSWLYIVFPALCLCYLGQGALLLREPTALVNPFLNLFPDILRIPVIVLSTAATLIASQSVISGVFSLTRQAIQLDFLPRMLIRHTSTKTNGQIYLPVINYALCVAVIGIAITFGSSEALTGAYGVAVSGTLGIDTVLFVYLWHKTWRQPAFGLIPFAAIFLTIDAAFIVASLPKLPSGGWLPVLIAAGIFVLITTWTAGQKIIMAERKHEEGKLQPYVTHINKDMPELTRLPGQAVYIGHHKDYAPLALHTSIEGNHELHEHVLIVSVEIENYAHIPDNERALISDLNYDDGISHVSLRYGYHDVPNVPKSLGLLRDASPDLAIDLRQTEYFVSMSKVVRTNRHNMTPWRKYLYCLMDRNALSITDSIGLPIRQTTEMSSLLKL